MKLKQPFNEKLVKVLGNILEADKRGELHRDPLDTDELFKESQSLLDSIKGTPG